MRENERRFVVSKTLRDLEASFGGVVKGQRKENVKTGAKVGAGIGIGTSLASLAASRGRIRSVSAAAARDFGTSQKVVRRAAYGGAAIGAGANTAVGAGLGAGVGALVPTGRKKKD
jgi:hypothetical protein